MNWKDPYLTKDKTTGYNNFTTRTMSPDSKIESFPGVFPASRKHLRFMKKLYKVLVKEFPKNDEVPEGVEYPGVTIDWKQLFNVAGISPDYSGIPPPQRKYIMKQTLGDTDDVKQYLKTGNIDPQCQKFMLIVLNKLMGFAQPDAIPIKKEANCGLPQMERGLDYKINIVELWNKDFSKILPQVRRKDWKGLYDNFNIVTAYFNAYRDQHDSFVKDEKTGIYKSKKREVVCLDKYIKDTKQGKSDPGWTTVDKRIDPSNPRCPSERDMAPVIREILDEENIEASAVRRRQISASSKSSSYPLQIVASGMYNYTVAKYPILLNDTGADDLTDRFRGYEDVSFWDIKNHDQNIPHFLIDEFLNFIKNNFDEWVYNLTYRSFYAPILVRNDRTGGPSEGIPNVAYIGEPFGPEVNDPGNNSGNPFTSVIAKFMGITLWMGALYMVKSKIPVLNNFFRKYTLDEAAEMLLRNAAESPVLICNAGDNIANGFLRKQAGFVDYIPNALACTRWDQSNDYKGLVRIYREGTEPSFNLKLSSFILKTLLPERSYHSRSSWDLGYLEKLKIYQKSPMFDDLVRVVNECFNDEYNVTGWDLFNPEIIARVSYNNRRPDTTVEQAVSIYDIAFLEDPDVIHYKIDPEWLSPGLYDRVFYSVDPQNYNDLLRSMFKYGSAKYKYDFA